MRALIALAALPLALAACSSQEPLTNDEVAGSNVVEEVPMDEATAPEINAPEPANVVVAPPPVDQAARDAQIQEDADATGMTARLPSSEQDTQPAEEAEQEQR